MSITVVTPANLGQKQNIPTADIAPVLQVFQRRGLLGKVICQINTQYPFRYTYVAVPFLIRLMLGVLRRMRIPITRPFEETLFDFFASKKIGNSEVVLFHGGYFLPCTLERVQSNKSITIDLARTEHFDSLIRLERKELRYLGFEKYVGPFERQNKKSEHHNHFDYVIALSEYVKQTYCDEEFPSENIFVATPDIDTNRFAPRATSKSDTTFRVMYAAYTTPLKGLHYLLDAWQDLALKDAELVLVGDLGDMPEALRTQYQERVEHDSSILFFGNTPTPEKWYQKSDVFVFPSLSEGFGRVTLEAMACGIPVITTENARGIVEDGKTGFVVPIRDATAIAEKIKYLYDHQDIALQMGRDARKAVEEKKPFGEAVYEIYQEIMRREQKR